MRSGSLSQQTDEQLAALGRGGSDEAFAEIVRRYEPVLRAKCTRIAGRNLADDALAQTWLQAFAALRRPRHPPALQPWLHRVAYNCAIDQVRARRQQESLMPPRVQPSDSPEAELERKQSLRDLVKGLSTLPENQRDALVLREFEGWSYAQIAEWVEEPPTGIHQLIFRARAALRRGLCGLAPWTPLRSLLQQLAALTPGGSGGSLRFGLAMIGTALLSGGTVSSGVATTPSDREPVERAQRSTVQVARDSARAEPHTASHGRPFAVLPASAGPRTGEGISLRLLVWTGHGPAPDAPAELVPEGAPSDPEPVSPPPSAEVVAPVESGQGTPVPAPVEATPASDPVSPPPPETETPTESAPASEPAEEAPATIEPEPVTGDHPGRGHGPPSWAPAHGHDKQASA